MPACLNSPTHIFNIFGRRNKVLDHSQTVTRSMCIRDIFKFAYLQERTERKHLCAAIITFVYEGCNQCN